MAANGADSLSDRPGRRKSEWASRGPGKLSAGPMSTGGWGTESVSLPFPASARAPWLSAPSSASQPAGTHGVFPTLGHSATDGPVPISLREGPRDGTGPAWVIQGKLLLVKLAGCKTSPPCQVADVWLGGSGRDCGRLRGATILPATEAALAQPLSRASSKDPREAGGTHTSTPASLGFSLEKFSAPARRATDEDAPCGIFQVRRRSWGTARLSVSEGQRNNCGASLRGSTTCQLKMNQLGGHTLSS